MSWVCMRATQRRVLPPTVEQGVSTGRLERRLPSWNLAAPGRAGRLLSATQEATRNSAASGLGLKVGRLGLGSVRDTDLCDSRVRPNGSRLSCGRTGRWRKAAEPPIELVGDATQFFPLA